jgi:hypothetical protein
MTSLPALITSDAEADLDDAVTWYELVGNGLEQEFIRAFDARLAAIPRNIPSFIETSGARSCANSLTAFFILSLTTRSSSLRASIPAVIRKTGKAASEF